MKKVIAIAILPLVLILAACSTQGTSHADPKASSASAVTAHKTNPLLKSLGDVITYTDGVSVSVSQGSLYMPSQEAAGVVAGNTNLVFTVVVTNHSKVNLDLESTDSVNSGGEAASSITDIGANVGSSPDTTILPGQTIKWQDAFSVKDPKDITFEVVPNFDYQNAIFVSKN